MRQFLYPFLAFFNVSVPRIVDSPAIRQSVYYVFLLLVFLASCQKEKEYPDPLIVFLSPYENASFQVTDTIRVKAEVTATEDPVTAAEVNLVNEDLMAVLSPVPVSVPEPLTSLSIDCLLPIDDIQLESGNYFLQIHVKTAHNEKNKYLPVRLVALPRKLQGLVILTRVNPFTLEAGFLDTTGALSALSSFPCDYGYSGVLSSERHLFVGGRGKGILTAFHLDSLTNSLELHGWDNPDLPWLQGLSFHGKDVLVSDATGTLTAYDRYGKMGFTLYLGMVEYPSTSLVVSNYILVNVLEKSGSRSWLRRYYYPGGGAWDNLEIPFRILALFALDDGKILVAGNDASQGIVKVFVPSQNGFESYFTAYLAEKLKTVARMDPSNFLLLTESDLRWLQYPSFTINTFVSLPGASCLAYEDLSGQVAIGRDKEIRFYHFPGQNQTGSLLLQDTVKAIHFLYNK